MMRQLILVAIFCACFVATASANDGCTETTTPGCGGCNCESCVCGLDSYCCSTAWDSLCVDACQNTCGGCGGGGGGACGSVTYQGCCQGQVVMYCENDSLQQLDCTENPSCGWSAEVGYYDCGTVGSGDPSGLHPINCGGGTTPFCGNGICEAGENADTCPGDCGGGTCTPSCVGKDCGDDGCGGSCGICPEPGFCTWDGQCESLCTPDCQGAGGAVKECGPDGCGGQCGACGIGKICDEATGTCGDDTGACLPDCPLGVQCGPDGCGDVCGECPLELACSQEGLCVDPSDPGICVPDCTGTVCGDDGCGGSCGICPDGNFCNDSGLCELGDGPDGGGGNPYTSDCPPGQSLLYGKCISMGVDSGEGGGEGCGTGSGATPLWALLAMLPLLRRRIRNPI